MFNWHGTLTVPVLVLILPLSTYAQVDTPQRGASHATESACDTIAVMVRTVPGAKLALKRGSITSLDGRHTEAATCTLILTGTWKAIGKTTPPQIIVDSGLAARGKELVDQRADGPNGGEFAFQRYGVLCKVSARWEEASDARPTQPVSDVYTVEVACRPSP
jgi:hypothetical protein